jgi:hypothetical protein
MSVIKELFLITPIYYRTEDLRFFNVSAIVAAPFNRHTDGTNPDESNLAIAHSAQNLMSELRIPFFGQYEQTSILLNEASKKTNSIQPEDIHGVPLSGGNGEWVQTTAITPWIAKSVLALGKNNRVAVVGHPHHIVRVCILLRAHGLDPYPSGYSKLVPYDGRKLSGSQWWCRSRPVYIPWEIACRSIIFVKTILGISL